MGLILRYHDDEDYIPYTSEQMREISQRYLLRKSQGFNDSYAELLDPPQLRERDAKAATDEAAYYAPRVK